MSGAVKSVFGGSGGLFGAVLGVASMFFPPLAIAGSMSNLLTSAIGQAVKELTKDSDPAVDDHVRQQAGDKKSAGKEGKEAAAENAKATTEMQATSQMFNLMQSGFSNAIKSIGEGLTQMARKG